MKKNLTFLFAVIVLSLPFWAGVNALQTKTENFIYKQKLAQTPPLSISPSVLAARIVERPSYPEYYNQLENYKIQAKSAISIEVNKQGEKRILFQKDIENILPIASLTKLVTAIVASEFYKDTEEINISGEAVSQLGGYGFLRIGEVLLPEELLHIMLIESSNDAAYAITELIGNEGFVALMNIKANDIGMSNTHFYNPVGLDPEDMKRPENEINHSTVSDLVKLSTYLIKNYPKILEISSKEQYNLYLDNGGFHHTIFNTNELLVELDNVVGSKTGITEKAGGCLILITENKDKTKHYINIVLNSPDRFNDMRKLIMLNFQ